jgi:hypothetical protein
MGPKPPTTTASCPGTGTTIRATREEPHGRVTRDSPLSISISPNAESPETQSARLQPMSATPMHGTGRRWRASGASVSESTWSAAPSATTARPSESVAPDVSGRSDTCSCRSTPSRETRSARSVVTTRYPSARTARANTRAPSDTSQLPGAGSPSRGVGVLGAGAQRAGTPASVRGAAASSQRHAPATPSRHGRVETVPSSHRQTGGSVPAHRAPSQEQLDSTPSVQVTTPSKPRSHGHEPISPSVQRGVQSHAVSVPSSRQRRRPTRPSAHSHGASELGRQSRVQSQALHTPDPSHVDCPGAASQRHATAAPGTQAVNGRASGTLHANDEARHAHATKPANRLHHIRVSSLMASTARCGRRGCTLRRCTARW